MQRTAFVSLKMQHLPVCNRRCCSLLSSSPLPGICDSHMHVAWYTVCMLSSLAAKAQDAPKGVPQTRISAHP